MNNNPNDMTVTEYARMLKALGEPTRLRIFQFLRSCCCPVQIENSGDVRPVQQGDGPATVGEVCCHLTGDNTVNPNVSFHLKELRNAGLITMERRGRKPSLRCRSPCTFSACRVFWRQGSARRL